jgi:hypothetical protein
MLAGQRQNAAWSLKWRDAEFEFSNTSRQTDWNTFMENIEPLGSSKPYVIGQQMADALSHEQARLKHGDTPQSPLPRDRYKPQPGRWELLNPVPSDLDTQMHKSCEEFRALSELGRAQFSSAISLDEFYTLIEFARRTAVFALRERNTQILRGGLIAVAMIEAKRTDFRDILVVLALLHHTASKIGPDPDVLFRNTAKIAERQVAELMIGFADRDKQNKNLRDSWGYLEVKTEFGLGFVRWGFRPYAPQTDLLAIAMRMASVVDADSYQTDSIELATDFPKVWLETPESNLLHQELTKIRAGATVSAHLRANAHDNARSQQFTIFIVEMDSEESANALLKLSQTKKPKTYCMLGFVNDQVFSLVVARSYVQGAASFEQGESLNRFKESIQGAIAQKRD